MKSVAPCSTVVATALLLVGHAAAQRFFVNGGFETGDFSGWTQFGDTSFSGVSMSFAGETPHEGAYFAYFGPTSPGGIQQMIAGPAGTYHVDFWWACAGGSSSDYMDVTLGGVPVFHQTGATNPTWQEFAADVPVGANPVLQFTFLNSPSYWFLDGMFIPEPSSVLLLALLAACRRR